jgi:Ras family
MARRFNSLSVFCRISTDLLRTDQRNLRLWTRAGIDSDAVGCVLVYSVTSRSSFKAIEELARELHEVIGPPVQFALVGSKCDLGDEATRRVSSQEGQDLAQSLGCEFYEASAKTGVNVDQIFTDLVRALRSLKGSNMEPGGGGKVDEQTGRRLEPGEPARGQENRGNIPEPGEKGKTGENRGRPRKHPQCLVM